MDKYFYKYEITDALLKEQWLSFDERAGYFWPWKNLKPPFIDQLHTMNSTKMGERTSKLIGMDQLEYCTDVALHSGNSYLVL